MSSEQSQSASPPPPPPSQHGVPEEGAECQACMEDLDGENYAEYRATAGECVFEYM